jgi:hypothetical protein
VRGFIDGNLRLSLSHLNIAISDQNNLVEELGLKEHVGTKDLLAKKQKSIDGIVTSMRSNNLESLSHLNYTFLIVTFLLCAIVINSNAPSRGKIGFCCYAILLLLIFLIIPRIS